MKPALNLVIRAVLLEFDPSCEASVPRNHPLEVVIPISESLFDIISDI